MASSSPGGLYQTKKSGVPTPNSLYTPVETGEADIQEFKVQRNSFNAEHGFTGGAVFNVVARCGTNETRGSLFESLR